MSLENSYIALSPDCSLKGLEKPSLYNKSIDELYELDEEAFSFLKGFINPKSIEEIQGNGVFMDYCFEERIIAPVYNRLAKRKCLIFRESPRPSLRYLEILLTLRCNLNCIHCYLGDSRNEDIDYHRLENILHEFEALQGLRVLLSGGEPLLYKDFWRLNETLPNYNVRFVLISNGSLIEKEAANLLNVQEVQISLDGMEDSHDYIRGRGSFRNAVGAIEILKEMNKDVSIATMLFPTSLRDLPEMERFLKEIGIKEWSIDLPCYIGNMRKNPAELLSYQEAAPYLRYAFGGDNHGGAAGLSCGSHLCAVDSRGRVSKCSFYRDTPIGDIDEGLENCWKRLKHYSLQELNCNCPYLQECRGGCRYRALLYYNNPLAPDPLYCALYENIEPKGGELDEDSKG